MWSTALRKVCLLTICSLVLGFGPEGSQAAPGKGLSPQCGNLNFASAQSLFECMGTIRYPNGMSKFQNMDRGVCAAILKQFFREIDRLSVLRDETQPIPSCGVVAEVAKMMTGKAPFWSACTDYPAPDPKSHMQKCMQAFAPAYYGARGFETQIRTCEGFRRGYEIALKAANNRHTQQIPRGYGPPACGTINEVIATVTGGGIQWQGCANYDPTRVREHLLACVATLPREFGQWHDCGTVRTVYEERLRATHGGLPSNYSILSCDDAQVVLDKAVAYRRAQEPRPSERSGSKVRAAPPPSGFEYLDATMIHEGDGDHKSASIDDVFRWLRRDKFHCVVSNDVHWSGSTGTARGRQFATKRYVIECRGQCQGVRYGFTRGTSPTRPRVQHFGVSQPYPVLEFESTLFGYDDFDWRFSREHVTEAPPRIRIYTWSDGWGEYGSGCKFE